MQIEKEYNKIYRYFKNTLPAFSTLDWDGDELLVVFNDRVIERYTREDLIEIGVL